MRTDPLPTFGYVLRADNVTLAFLKRATFLTTDSFEFEVPLFMNQRFLDSLSKRGYLLFHSWSLTTLNTALQSVGRVVWDYARVARIRFPELNNGSLKPLRIFVHMAVARAREVGPDSGTATTETASAMTSHRDPLPPFAFEWKIDGLGSTFSVFRIDAFNLGDGVSQDLVLTIKPEPNADPYRDWLNSGSNPRDGSLIFLNTALQVFFTIGLTGLRIRSVTPALTTHSPNPATVRLTYSDIRFGV